MLNLQNLWMKSIIFALLFSLCFFERDYAELVRSRIESMNLVVETVHLSPTVSLADALDDAAQRGLLYAAIITSQHEMHRSVTLTILHGRNPQGKGKLRLRLLAPKPSLFFFASSLKEDSFGECVF